MEFTVDYLLTILLKLLLTCGCLAVSVFAVCLLAGLIIVIISAVRSIVDFVADSCNIFKKT